MSATRTLPSAVLHAMPSALDEFRADILRGLTGPAKHIPCKYLYDARGAELYDQICTLDAYYPTRKERWILEAHGTEIASCLGPRCQVVELGSGSGAKTRLLLTALEDPVAYVPIDISREQLASTAQSLAEQFPHVEVLPLCADYMQGLTLPAPRWRASRIAVFFPGSTIGNFEPDEAARFLESVGALAGPGGVFLIGVDRKKDSSILERAYNDPEGVTAAFNLNLLERINRELGAEFRPERFRHRAIYNAAAGRIEMQLLSLRTQSVRVPQPDGGYAAIRFAAGDVIVTEHSYKYAISDFTALAERSGLATEQVWSDPKDFFSVFLLRVPPT